jgi:exodeoxyribonuclease VII small subunit
MKNNTFEDKLAQSKKLLDALMHADITLEASVNLYEEGLANIEEAQKMIEEAKMKITLIEKGKQ